MPRSYPPQVIGSGSRGNQPGTAQLISNSPRRTCNIRRPGKSTCSVATRAAASKPGNTGKRLRAQPKNHRSPLRAKRVSPGRAQPLQRRYRQHPVGREQPLLSRNVPRPDVYSTSPSKGKAAGGLSGACREGAAGRSGKMFAPGREGCLKPLGAPAHHSCVG